MKKVLITGGTRGFGLAYANLLTQKGFKVIKVASKNADHNIDLTTLWGTHELIKLIQGLKPELVILNAGFGGTKYFETYSEKEILAMQHINGTHKALVLNAFFEQIKNNNMQFIVASSIAGKVPSPLMAAYSASKAYCSNLIASLNGELLAQGIENLIIDATPGNIKTHEQSEEVKAYAKKVLTATNWKVFNKPVYNEVLFKPLNNWSDFVKQSYKRKVERINARKN